MTAEPLPAGTILTNRFEILRVLGHGGFAIAYLALDRLRQNQTAIKELAPMGSKREGLMLHLSDQNPHRLRSQFLDEARTLARLDLPGVLPVRATFHENGTAYYATDYVQGSRTLQDILDADGPMDADGALDIFFQLLETLGAMHAKRIIHRDIKPSNILIEPSGRAILIDFGAAREWHADSSHSQTILFTPGYAPLEQLAERAARGPGTDLYALCATMYHMLTGTAPISATDRAAGVPLSPIAALRRGIEPDVTRAVEAGLSLRLRDRPASAAELRRVLSESASPDPTPLNLMAYDREIVRLHGFRYQRRACPSCGSLLEDPRPLGRRICPVCQGGLIKKREISDRACPQCRIGALHRIDNSRLPAFCPTCHKGRLEIKRVGLLRSALRLSCRACKTEYENPEARKDALQLVGRPESSKSYAEWRAIAARSQEVWLCDSCEAQFDVLEDGRRRIVTSSGRPAYECLYPEEWARVAAGLDPGSGNATCISCNADYYLDRSCLTLLDAQEDPFGFAALFTGRLLELEDARWLGVGKESANRGLTCRQCHTEFDREGDYYRLVRTLDPGLSRHTGEPFTLEDWHRLGQGLPTVADEPAFIAGIHDAILDAYKHGQIGFDTDNVTMWSGEAHNLDSGQSGLLTIDSQSISFAGKRNREPLDALIGVKGVGDDLTLRLRGKTAPLRFELEPMELVVKLESGDRVATVRAEDLAVRLTRH